MTSKFNKEMYKKIKEKKNEPLSSIGQKKLRFTDKEREKEKEKEMVEKVGSSIWSDAEAVVDRVNEFFTLGEMKEISSTPSHEMVNRHVHKLVQVIPPVFVHPFLFFFFGTNSWGGFLLVRCWVRPCTSRPST